MPIHHHALTLDSGPRSVQEARQWVASACEELGREDLTECAELGVSELVTNALLHADDPIVVRVRGTRAHPRVEVSDGSHQPPVLPLPEPHHEFDELMSTFGRGLAIVARCSVAWGAEMEHDGKVVWFEPALSPRQDAYTEGRVYHLPHRSPEPEVVESADHTVVTIMRVPLDALSSLRRHYLELHREVRLLSLAHEEDYPLAKSLTETFARFDAAFPEQAMRQAAEATEAGLETTDIKVALDPAVAVSFDRMLTLLDLADEFCRSQRLLTLERTVEQAEFQRWFLGEFVRQSRGLPPTAWDAETSQA